jgi:hypothetical protein
VATKECGDSLDSFFLGYGADLEVSLLLLGGCQGEENSWLWLGAPENRVFGQYIVYSVRGFTGVIGFKLLDPRALGHL